MLSSLTQCQRAVQDTVRCLAVQTSCKKQKLSSAYIQCSFISTTRIIISDDIFFLSVKLMRQQICSGKISLWVRSRRSKRNGLFGRRHTVKEKTTGYWKLLLWQKGVKQCTVCWGNNKMTNEMREVWDNQPAPWILMEWSEEPKAR